MRNSEINLLVKPTHECDLMCEYCYDRIEKSKVKNKIITDDLIKEIAIKSCRAFENVNWIWHGGEPTIAGIDFYKRNIKVINEIANKYNTNIKFSMQSNGKNISNNKEFLKELSNLEINVSLSLDFTNNNIYRSSKEEFNNILKTVKKNNLSIINVINKEDFENLIYNYKRLENENINFMFNKRFNNYENEESMNFIINNYKKYIDFILFEIDDIKDRTIKDIILSVISPESNKLCTLSNCIGTFININPDGDIFPCDRYGKSNSKNYNFINIKDIEFSLLEYLNSDVIKKLIDDNKFFINKYCKNKCNAYLFCNSSCKANRIDKNNNIDLKIKMSEECKFLQEIFGYISSILFNLKKSDFLKINNEVYNMLFENNFVTKEMISEIIKEQ